MTAPPKRGVDDYLAAGGTMAALSASPIPFEKWLEAQDLEALTGPYVVRGGCICYRKRERDGDVTIPLCNFTARISTEILFDDGAEEHPEFQIEGVLKGGISLPPIRVPSSQFSGMNWPLERWGSRAVVSAGSGSKDRLREAIQLLSGEVPTHRVYGHTGWRQVDRKWVYLHGAGAIGADGTEDAITVELTGNLRTFKLPDPPEGADLVEAICSSLAILDIAPTGVTAPVLGATYRAPLGEVAETDFSVHLHGQTGVFKTELAALAQAHFGAGYTRTTLPADWSATPNALERLAFEMKDAVLVVDDFAPTGGSIGVARIHATADRLFRGSGNRAGRGRMSADGRLRPTYYPRGIVISTGEDEPRGQSLRARYDSVSVGADDIDPTKLSAAQRDRDAGRLAAAMAAYLRWLAPRIDVLRTALPQRIAYWQAKASGSHRRVPTMLASLMVGWEQFLWFAHESGVLTAPEASVIATRVWTAFLESAAEQATSQADEESAGRFLQLVAAATSSERAHLAGTSGGPPTDSDRWGWRDGLPRGELVGWAEEVNVYLDPNLSYAQANRLAHDQGDALAVTPRTLWRRLDEKHLLASTDEKRGKNLVRRTLGGRRREVLHLLATAFEGPSPSPAEEQAVGPCAPDTDGPTYLWGSGPIGPLGPTRPEADMTGPEGGP